MTNQTTTFRKRIDFLINCALILKTSAETTLAWRSLQMAKAWLGQALGKMGQPTPYTVADNPGAIPPTADTYEGDLPESLEGLEGINYMRQKISEIHFVLPQEEEQKRCYRKAADYLAEARMWYGFELANMRASNARELTENETNELMGRIASTPGLDAARERALKDYFDSDQPMMANHNDEWHDPIGPPESPEFTDEELEAIVPVNPPKKKKK